MNSWIALPIAAIAIVIVFVFGRIFAKFSARDVLIISICLQMVAGMAIAMLLYFITRYFGATRHESLETAAIFFGLGMIAFAAGSQRKSKNNENA